MTKAAKIKLNQFVCLLPGCQLNRVGAKKLPVDGREWINESFIFGNRRFFFGMQFSCCVKDISMSKRFLTT